MPGGSTSSSFVFAAVVGTDSQHFSFFTLPPVLAVRNCPRLPTPTRAVARHAVGAPLAKNRRGTAVRRVGATMSGLGHHHVGFAEDNGLQTDSDDERFPPQSASFALTAHRPRRGLDDSTLPESVYARAPFVMPKETDMFALREEERVLKTSTRARLANLSVRDKTTFSSRTGSAMSGARLEIDSLRRGGETKVDSFTMGSDASFFEKSMNDLGGSLVITGGSDELGGTETRKETGEDVAKRPESVADFVAKKREIFLVQMSLDAKRAEILKLELDASRREDALAVAEATLVEDAKRFEDFLKENDARVQEAIKAGEYEAKHKNDKASEIKRLAADIVVAEAGLGKKEDKRADCERYKAFLDQLTPIDFFEDVHAKRRKRRTDRRDVRRARRAAHQDLINAASFKEAAIAKFQDALQEATRRGRTAENLAREALENAKAGAFSARAAIPEKAPPGTPENDSSGEETPMYFVRPSQLPEVFVRLEEKNLFLMQNGQEAEEALEELKASQRVVRLAMENDAENLLSQIETLKNAIAVETAEALELRGRDAADEKAARRKQKMEKINGGSSTLGGTVRVTGATTSDGFGGTIGGTTIGGTMMGGTAASLGDFPPAQKLRADAAAAGASIPLDDLTKKVGETYAKCGFDYDPTMSTVQMLTQIESKLERCLQVADEMPPAYVRESEKAREKARRINQRVEKAAVDLIAAEEKAAKALERSMAPVTKKVGKPLMLRSQPLSRKKKIVKEQLTAEEAELREFLATEF